MSYTMTGPQPNEHSRRAKTLPPLDVAAVSCVAYCDVIRQAQTGEAVSEADAVSASIVTASQTPIGAMQLYTLPLKIKCVSG